MDQARQEEVEDEGEIANEHDILHIAEIIGPVHPSSDEDSSSEDQRAPGAPPFRLTRSLLDLAPLHASSNQTLF